VKTLAVLSQKGGVGKSTIARLMATAYAGAGWRVKIADFHTKQLASVEWAGVRLKHEARPAVPSEAFPNVKKALTQQTQYDLMVFDGKPSFDVIMLEIARESDMILVPAGVSLDDLRPQVKFAHELLTQGIDRKDILFVLNKSLDSAASITDAKGFIEAAGYQVAQNDLPSKTGYQLAQNNGRAVNESAYPSLNERADALAQEIIDRLSAALVPIPGQARQNMTTAGNKVWHDLSFKVTLEQLKDFRLEAARREMKQKDPLLAMWQLYRATFPVPNR
jgi:chromosome partitioning protein